MQYMSSDQARSMSIIELRMQIYPALNDHTVFIFTSISIAENLGQEVSI